MAIFLPSIYSITLSWSSGKIINLTQHCFRHLHNKALEPPLSLLYTNSRLFPFYEHVEGNAVQCNGIPMTMHVHILFGDCFTPKQNTEDDNMLNRSLRVKTVLFILYTTEMKKTDRTCAYIFSIKWCKLSGRPGS